MSVLEDLTNQLSDFSRALTTTQSSTHAFADDLAVSFTNLRLGVEEASGGLRDLATQSYVSLTAVASTASSSASAANDIAAGMVATADRAIEVETIVEGIERGLTKSAAETALFSGKMFMLNRYMFSLRQDLIQANSDFEHRRTLFEETLKTSTDIGQSLSVTTKSAQALVAYGMQNEASWQANLRTVTELSEGLGVSVEMSAKLAAVVERRLGSGFSKIADDMASIVNSLHLSGDEVAKIYADTIEMSAGLGDSFKIGTSEVAKAISEYESANKSLGGTVGEIQQLFAKLTTIEGQTAAGLFGIGSGVDAVRTAENVHAAMAKMADAIESFGQGQGAQRAFQMEAVAGAIGMSREAMIRLAETVKQRHRQDLVSIGIQQRYTEQMTAAGQSVGQLKDQFMTLLQSGLLPVISAIDVAASKLSYLVSVLNDIPAVRTGAQWLLGVGGVLAAGTLAYTQLKKLFGLFGGVSSIVTRIKSSIRDTFGALFGSVSGAAPRTVAAAGLRSASYVGLLLSIVQLLDALVEEAKVTRAYRDSEKVLKNMSQRLLETQQAKLTEAFVSGNQELMLNALFGFKQNGSQIRTGGLVQTIAAERKIAFQEALDSIMTEFVKPTAEVMRATTASKTLSTDEKGNPLQDVLEERLRQMTDAITKAASTSADQYEKATQAQIKAAEERRRQEALESRVPTQVFERFNLRLGF